MRKFGVVLLVVFLFASVANAQKKVLDKIVAVVGSNIILLSDIETGYAQYLLQGTPPNPALKCQIAQNLISQKLLTAQAVIDSIEVKESEIDDEVDRRMRQSIQRAGGEDKLAQFLGRPVEQYKDEIRPDVKEMLVSERMRSKITEKVNTTPLDVKKYFETFKKDSLPMISKEVEVGEIVFNPKLTNEEKEYSKQKAEGLLARVKAGEDFAALAIAYSQDPKSAVDGGDLGWGSRGDYVKEFSAVAFKLKTGEVSPVFESDFGYHFLQLIERRGEQVHTRHILIIPAITAASLVRAEVKADSVYQLLMKNKVTSDIFSSAATYYSDDKESKYNGGMILNAENVQTRTTVIPIDKLDPQIALVIDTMKVNTVSKPVLITDAAGKKSYKIFYLRSVTDAHRANMNQDFAKIKTAANEDKINRTISEWFEKKRKETFIKIDPEYQSCPTLTGWATPPLTQAKL
ncbi:MAG: peptidylprolyl isomerase [Mucilaginibacter sp.]